MRHAARTWSLGLFMSAMLAAPALADSRSFLPCTGPRDPLPCLLEGAEPDRSRLPAAGPAAWVSGDRLVISWVGEADEVRVVGNIQFPGPLPQVAPGLFQAVLQYPQAQRTRIQLRFAVTRSGDTEVTKTPTELAGLEAFALLRDGDIAPRMQDFGAGLPRARVWLPPGYRAGVRYPILYLADGGMMIPGAWLTEPIRRGELAPLIVVGVEYAAAGQEERDTRSLTYLGAPGGGPAPAFLAHERFLLDTVIPMVEKTYGAPPERRLRAIGGASNGGVWTASMALRNPGLFGTAFVMSPGVRPYQHGAARSSVRFYVSAGDLEPAFRWAAGCLAGDIVARGGVASFATYPSGHDFWMWGRVLLTNARDWLAPRQMPAVPAALPAANCATPRR
ncbi:esterase family protein [Massilia sp. Leaf139]|uniref:alpha/beta hydrolase n=1 Tax=Massilia sp. Leaf139 TaxID=1736272 RepID=UPI0006F49C9D|nr:alpha/beta hydrolase-fold protein [Massilia sp. Leaf139]KQQ88948.1 hypothetical protein ASF77_09555 [Massilia sp. Leaf139]